jgi:hypothetical protein
MTNITGGLITLEFASTGLNYSSVGAGGQTARDADITAYVQAATPIIEDIVGSCLQVSKTIAFDGGNYAINLNDNVTAITSVVEAGNPLNSATDYMFDPIANQLVGGGPIVGRAFYPGRLCIVVTYTAGFTTIPMNIQMATRELVRFWVQQGKQGWRPNGQMDADSVAWTPSGFAVPKRVIELLAPNRHLGGFA